MADLQLLEPERDAAWGFAHMLDRKGYPGYAAIVRVMLARLNIRPAGEPPEGLPQGGESLSDTGATRPQNAS